MWSFFTNTGARKESQSGGSMEVIFDTTLGASAASIDSNTILGGDIPQTYAHLKLVISARTDRAANEYDGLRLRINNDSSANYRYSWLSAYNSTVTHNVATGQTSAFLGYALAASAAANRFAKHEVLIPDYRNGYRKDIVSHGASVTGNAGATSFRNDATVNQHDSITAAITRLSLFSDSGNLVAGTRVTLYGLKV